MSADGWHDPKLPDHGLMPFSFIGASEHFKEAAREYAEIYARKALAAQRRDANNPLTAYSIELLVAGGLVSREKADEAYRIACETFDREARK